MIKLPITKQGKRNVTTPILIHRKATLGDLRAIVRLLSKDELGQNRDHLGQKLDQCYVDAFQKIDADPNHYLMVVESNLEIVGTCHLTLMPSLTFRGSTRLQIEAVRVLQKYRGKRIGEWMIMQTIEYARSKRASIIQITSNKSAYEQKNSMRVLALKQPMRG